MMTKILVTGGTGLVGAHLLYSLTKNGAYPIAIKRATSNIQNVKKIFSYYSDDSETLFQQIQWKECDVLDIVKLDLIIKEVTYIYHSAALISFNNKLKDKMIEINATGTANIIDLAIKHDIQKICYVSSIATLGSNHNLPIDESCFWDWTNQSGYAISKHLAEMEIWRGVAEGLNGVIVNPSLIIGPGSWDSGIGTIIKKSKIGSPFYPPGSCGVIDVEDLVQIMISLMDSTVTNERFIINSEHMSYKNLMSVVAKKFNKKPPYIKLKRWTIKCFIFLDIMWSKLWGKPIELSTDAVKYTTNEIILNSSKINKKIKYNYRNAYESLEKCVSIFEKEKLRT
jgi:dihydroflavonol-4-reductase